MSASDIGSESRRQFLKFLSGSPLLAYPGLGTGAADGPTAPPRLSDPILRAPLRTEDLSKSPAEAINVFEFEPVARKTVPPAHFGYMASGIDDEVTLRANREGFLKFQLRPRRLNVVSKVDMSCELFGSRWSTPIVIAPAGGNKFFHPEGELAVARAAKAGSHLQILSTSASTSVEDATKARGAPIWFQLYASPSWDVARALIKRAEGAGCPVLVVTVDRVAGRNQETLFRPRREDSGRSTIDALPEIVEAVRGRIPVLVDSGFRRGTDIVKGLALGASAVCVGRPYLWGLGAFGQPGVERVLELLRSELQAAMQQCGVRSLRELTPAFVRRTT